MKLFFYTIYIVLFFSCSSDQTNVNPENRLIAKVYNEELYADKLSSMSQNLPTKEDSINISEAYIEQWIRESLIINEAKKNAPPDLNRLIEDYKKSLLKLHFENQIIEQRLDSFIDTKIMVEYYEENKTQYLLKEKAIQLFLIKCSKEKNFVKKIDEFWKSDSEKDLKTIALVNKDDIIFKENDWFKNRELFNLLPKSVVQRVLRNEGKRFTTEEEGFKYYIKVGEIKDKNEIPPLAVIDDQLSKVILHQRKKKILNEYIEELYDLELRKNSIKIYSK